MIPYTERVPIYEDAIRTYGPSLQCMVAIEEMSELTKELCKHERWQGSAEHIAEEIADVTIMMEQLRLIFNVNEMVVEIMERKLERLQNRLEVEHGVRGNR